jgi:Spy/CpxP family protein refolding chaperone
MKLRNTLLTAAMAVTLCTTGAAMAQNDNGGGGGGGGGRRGGNFDPAQMQQRMMENIRDQMNVTNNEEWQVIETRVQKVMDARRDAGPAGNFGRLFRRRGGNEGDNGGGGGGRRGGGFFGGTPSPEQEALDKAVESNAPADQVKAAMKKYRDSRKSKEAALEKAQADLKKILTVKQEAAALSLGLIN